MSLRSPTTIEKVQKLTGKIATLNRFISRSADKSLPFYKTLRKTKNFEWSEECEKALQDLKEYLTKPPVLANPKEGETLFLYLAVSESAVSSVLVRQEGWSQSPIYYVSKMLQRAELRYSKMEKLTLALVITARRLRPYFQSHKIVVLTNSPMKHVMSRPEASGRLIKWAVELGQYDIDYQPRTAQKGPKEVEIRVAARFSFPITNNEAEYEALILGLELTYEVGARDLEVFTDSQLVALQIKGMYETREKTMTSYRDIVKNWMDSFDKCSILQVPRAENDKVDALSKFGAAMSGIKDPEVQTISKGGSWKDEMVRYLENDTLPKNPVEAKRLYKRIVEGPLLKCLDEERAEYVMREIHEGSCGNHSGARSLAQKGHEGAGKEVRKLPEVCVLEPPTGDPHQWGIDIVGPFPPAQAQKKFLIVAVEYFSKWVEAEAVARISEKECKELKIAQHFTAVANPQANGQTEHLKTRLENKGSCVEELPGVLWAYRTTPRVATGETLFCLVYGTEAIIPAEIGEESQRIVMYDTLSNNNERGFDLTVIEEKRDAAYARILHHKGLMMKNHDRKVRPRQLQVGDLVLKKVEASKHVGKLDPTWEGPYKIIEIRKQGNRIVREPVKGHQPKKITYLGNLQNAIKRRRSHI
ncbi:UNVERIFIED_CONTAM: Ribonuclease HI [Sesamum indicum]